MTVGLNYGIKKDNDNLKDFVDSRGNQVHTSHKCSQLANWKKNIYLSIYLTNWSLEKPQYINRIIMELDKFTKYIFMVYLPPTK